MLVFYKAKLAFLSVPKTGTTAYETALRDHADLVISEPPMLKHAPVYRYNRFVRPMFAKVCNVDLEVMAVMREPISWLGSWWRYRQRPFMKGKKPGFADVGSQFKFLESQPNGTSVTHLFRYEDQPRLQQFLSDRLGVRLDLARENVSPDIAVTLSPDVEDKYRRKFDEEFALYESISKN